MHFLILGGTRFVGRAVVEAVLSAGHEVTLFNRGQTAPSLYPTLETVHGDRTADLSALAGRTFDVVVDCAGYQPAAVALSAGFFRDTVSRYAFVSTVSVYADQSVPANEDSALLADDSYGGRKAACEAAVRDAFPDRHLITRPGLIAGPHDQTDRLLYWPRRMARGGRVLAPGSPDDPTQLVDVRDMAEWIVRTDAVGVFNTVRPTLTMDELLAACRTVTGSDASLVWVPTADLLKAGVDPWMGVPMWIGEPESRAANLIDGSRADAAGMTHRALTATIGDSWAADVSGSDSFPAAEEERLLALLTVD